MKPEDLKDCAIAAFAKMHIEPTESQLQDFTYSLANYINELVLQAVCNGICFKPEDQRC